MDIFYLLLSMLGESAGNVFDRLNFKRTHIKVRQMFFLGFLGMSSYLWLFIFLTHQPFPHFTLVSMCLVILIALFSFGGNAFDYLSLEADDLSLREPIVDFYPILAGFFGYLLFPSERDSKYLLAFIAGSLVVYWGIHHIKMKRRQRKGIGYLLLALALYAVLPSLYKSTLAYINPAYIAAFRVSGILLLACIFLPIKSFKGLTPKRISYSAWSSLVCSVAAIVSLYAISAYGVVLTMLFYMLGPAIRYLAGQFILHEKVRRSEIIASVMLAVIVAVTAFMK